MTDTTTMSNKGKKWTEEEDRQLHSEIDKHTTVGTIATQHGRTMSSIVARMRHLHLYPRADKEELGAIPEPNSFPDSLICVIDTETTGKDIPLFHVSNSEKWEVIRIVQFAYELYRMDGTLVEQKCMMIQPDGFTISDEVIAIHGISNERAAKEGLPIQSMFDALSDILSRTSILVAHNMEYDSNVILSEMYRYHQESLIAQWNMTEKDCTMLMGKRLVKRWAKLSALAEVCSIPVPSGLHQADVDTHLCAQVYFYLRNKHISNRKHIFSIVEEDRELFKLLGGRWDAVHKVWTMDEAEPFFRYAKKWLL